MHTRHIHTLTYAHSTHTLTYAHTPSHMHTHIPFLDLAPTFSFDGHRISVPVSSMMCLKYCSALSLPYPPTKGGRRGRGREGEGEEGGREKGKREGGVLFMWHGKEQLILIIQTSTQIQPSFVSTSYCKGVIS